MEDRWDLTNAKALPQGRVSSMHTGVVGAVAQPPTEVQQVGKLSTSLHACTHIENHQNLVFQAGSFQYSKANVEHMRAWSRTWLLLGYTLVANMCTNSIATCNGIATLLYWDQCNQTCASDFAAEFGGSIHAGIPLQHNPVRR